MARSVTDAPISYSPPNDWPSPRTLIALGALWLIFTVYALLWLTLGTFDVLRPEAPNGLMFNNMLEHLLSGRFDIDPAAIDGEAFARGGRTYAYFGIFCAFLRLPLALVGRLRDTDMTTLSMVVAVSLGWLCRLAGFAIVYSRVPHNAATRTVFAIVVLAAMLGGENIQFLKTSIYQEVTDWAAALASGFLVLLLWLLLVPGARRRALLSGMAALAGLTLLTRSSTGFGLCLALSLILGIEVLRAAAHGWRAFGAELVSSRILVPAGCLALFVVIFGVVNSERWGNPLTTANYALYVKSHTVFLDRLPRLARYGQFNLSRVWFGLQYYFAPVWVFRGTDGNLLWQAWMLRLTDGVELPPSSFFLSDPVTCILGGMFLVRVVRGRVTIPLDRAVALASLCGLAVPALLMLAFLYFSLRYRGEFYPVLDLAAYLGLWTLASPNFGARRAWCAVLAVSGAVGVIVSHVTLVAHLITPLGPIRFVDMSHGLRGLYLSEWAALSAGSVRPREQ
jgi:hypothetical protein